MIIHADRHKFTSLTLAVFILSVAIANRLPGEETPKVLIDPELSQWQVFTPDAPVAGTNVWQVSEDRILKCSGRPLGYLYTRDSYRDVEFEFEWRWPEGEPPGRGGVLLRTTGPHKVWPKSLEVQLNATDAGDFWGLAGYELKGPAEKMKVLEHPEFGRLTNVKKDAPREKEPGKWNHCRVRLVGDKIVVEINGQAANEATGCELAVGPICLTAEGHAIEFRNVRLRELK